MKVVQINTSCGVGSTGKICVEISNLLSQNGIENYVMYGQGESKNPLSIRFSNSRYKKVQALKSRILGNSGFNSKKATKYLISHLEKINPDIVHLHNIHGHDCDLELLFSYFKKNNKKLIWTFHDCWAFTAYCPHFTMAKCDKWQTQCFDCVQRRGYSWFFDRSKAVFQRKKKLFSDLDITIVTPSQWLANLVKQSFLKEYPVEVINNGIDISVFKPSLSDFRCKYGTGDKRIVLGVAFDWGVKKGLDVFVELSKKLGDGYQIVLVGTKDRLDKNLPENIISIHRTQNQQELAEIYSAADVFVNPTREENYPTVNMEAIACGTPVLTFNTGGSPEILDNACGSVVECDDVDALEKEIIRICTDKPFLKDECIKKAKGFDKNEKFKEYLDLYARVNASGTQRN